MVSEIYSLPDSVNFSYAHSQQTYDEEVAKGMYTLDGRLEWAMSQAARVNRVSRDTPQLVLLMGTHLRSTLAFYPPPPPSWHQMRSRSHLEAPSLGVKARRVSDCEKLQVCIQALGDTPEEQSDRIKGYKLERAVQQTIQDNDLIAEIQGYRGSMVSS